MDFDNIEEIKKAGFIGFKTIKELFTNSSELPTDKGVYLVINLEQEPSFLEIGTGGHFNNQLPNVALEILNENWVEKTIVVYIGQAGGNDKQATLKSRLKEYLGFGRGKRYAHRGGRFIWQLANSNNLIICWKPLPEEAPRSVEANLIQDFKSQFNGKRPFANLAD